MQTTEHLNLNLPEATDPYDIGNENENMEILDSAIYNHGIILGSASTAGHNKIINDLSKTSLSNGEALSARMGNALGQMFAPIESSSTASRAYVIGAQFIYNGILYKATAAISQGGNINPGGNCTPASSVTSQISDLANVKNNMVSRRFIGSEDTIQTIINAYSVGYRNFVTTIQLPCFPARYMSIFVYQNVNGYFSWIGHSGSVSDNLYAGTIQTVSEYNYFRIGSAN